ncbi:MAG: hypothetical protein V1754_06125 [Pseudomonadota bacterium]
MHKPKFKNELLKGIPIFVAALFATGCTVKVNEEFWDDVIERAFCDLTGCYQCYESDWCWLLDNKKCVSNAACRSDEVCTNIGCVKLCDFDWQCAQEKTERCVVGYCAPKGFGEVTPYEEPTACEKDSDCPSNEYCGEVKTCVDRCKSDDECSPELVCTACGRCQPKEEPPTCGEKPNYCSESQPCGAKKQCLLGRCHFECGLNEDCPIGQVCQAGVCQSDLSPSEPACSLNLDCENGVCINGYCFANCNSSTECDERMICSVGVCRPDYLPAKQ